MNLRKLNSDRHRLSALPASVIGQQLTIVRERPITANYR
jgi:hypothetical protein